jgi:hypothetical protein
MSTMTKVIVLWVLLIGGAGAGLLAYAVAGRVRDAAHIRREARRTVAEAERLLQDAAR